MTKTAAHPCPALQQPHWPPGCPLHWPHSLLACALTVLLPEGSSYRCLWLIAVLPQLIAQMSFLFSPCTCYSKIPGTISLTNSRNSFLMVLEVGKPQINMLADPVRGQGPCSLEHGLHVPAVSSQGGRGQPTVWTLFYKGTNPIREGSTP